MQFAAEEIRFQIIKAVIIVAPQALVEITGQFQKQFRGQGVSLQFCKDKFLRQSSGPINLEEIRVILAYEILFKRHKNYNPDK